jgi:hypothetical protein
VSNSEAEGGAAESDAERPRPKEARSVRGRKQRAAPAVESSAQRLRSNSMNEEPAGTPPSSREARRLRRR